MDTSRRRRGETLAKRQEINDSQRWAFRIRDVALRSGLSESEVRRAVYAGELPARKYRGRVWLISPKDAETWLEEMCGPEAA